MSLYSKPETETIVAKNTAKAKASALDNPNNPNNTYLFLHNGSGDFIAVDFSFLCNSSGVDFLIYLSVFIPHTLTHTLHLRVFHACRTRPCRCRCAAHSLIKSLSRRSHTEWRSERRCNAIKCLFKHTHTPLACTLHARPFQLRTFRRLTILMQQHDRDWQLAKYLTLPLQ